MTGAAVDSSDGSGEWDDVGSARQRKHVGGLLHGLHILDMFGRERPEISIGEMANELGVHKSSASRLAATLAHAGYLVPTRTQGSYRLGGRIASLGHLMLQSLNVVNIVGPHLEHLTEVTGETGHLGVLRGGDSLTELVVDGWHTIRMHAWAGKVAPAYVSSMGKALLCGLTDDEMRALYSDTQFERFTSKTVQDTDSLVQQLNQIRERGYGLDDEELEIGMRCISAPVVDAGGVVVASISISGPSQRITAPVAVDLAEHVRWNAANASRDLGSRAGVPAGWPTPPAGEPPQLRHITRRPYRTR